MKRYTVLLPLLFSLAAVAGLVVPTRVVACSAPVTTPRIITVHTSTATSAANLVRAQAAAPSMETPTGTPTPTPVATSNPATSVQIGTGPFAFSVDLGDWITKLLAGTWKTFGVDGIKTFGDDIAGWLLRNPDLATSAGQMGNVQRMADALRLASVSVCIALFVAGVYRVWLGGSGSPVSSLGRLAVVRFCLGFYKPLAGWVGGTPMP